MGRIRRHFLASWGLAFVIGLVLPVCSAQVSISPVVIEIDMPRRPVAISVTNSGGRPIRLQAEVLLWQQTDGKDRYEPSDALLVVPSIVDVPANSTQVVRVVLSVPTGWCLTTSRKKRRRAGARQSASSSRTICL